MKCYQEAFIETTQYCGKMTDNDMMVITIMMTMKINMLSNQNSCHDILSTFCPLQAFNANSYVAALRHLVVRLERDVSFISIVVRLRSVWLTEMSVLWNRARNYSAAFTSIVRTSRIWYSVSVTEEIPIVKHDRAAQCFTVSLDSAGKSENSLPGRLRQSGDISKFRPPSECTGLLELIFMQATA